jgi:hypothetical protein
LGRLRSLGLERYEAAFRDKEIDNTVLTKSATESALRTISTPVFWSSFCVRTFLSASLARRRATPPAGKDTLLDRSSGRVHGIVHMVLALLDLDLARTADPDHRDAARKLGKVDHLQMVRRVPIL